MNFKELAKTYKGKRVLVTGDTGFKGSWLCEWLLMMGADIVGIGLEPDTDPSLFVQLGLEKQMDHQTLDIRDAEKVSKLVREVQPDILLHLAAQPLVRLSYDIPVETYATNVMGTVHLLNALRQLEKPCAAVFVTTDKCYENKEWLHSYREEDPMGGHDPYSSSKGACEIAIQSFRKSFFHNPLDRGIAVASARAGNVIGGGDWAEDRIVPDCIRALSREEAIPVRNRHATRPWQHVLEPLGGYLLLGADLWRGLNKESFISARLEQSQLCSAFNFGPTLDSNRPVAELVEEILKHWPGSWDDRSDPNALHEASLLNLAIDKARHVLGWEPRWDFEQTIANTVDWYRQVHDNSSNTLEMTEKQITLYSKNNV
ncbi:CDP-glucose 4,6-dehydratase [Puniceicoccales bacterium CK1056]|uniref:CDP-glucose 4,6-dehydratase n=1 Tax=Oceanipulchritudo coccoides TaxID=2706888 RepID=A0A6B2M4A1_9BACT|nr:CDP-glucose 4,6-dehydratase [Oceanipulchritudo coccoides]NDV63049.1 CDP-glucose 4,6-dehydratase [Oceanipulchritudo coccoides]